MSIQKGARLCLIVGAVSGILPVLAATVGVRLAPILPEITEHLAKAHTAMDKGDFAGVRAHATAVLIGDQVTYEVNFVSTTEADKPNCLKALRAAFDVWEQDLGDVRFREVPHSENPEISIVFKPSVRMGKEQVAGYTSWQRRILQNGTSLGETTFHADMQLRDRDLSFHSMSFEAMRHEACHETGHVLGLDDSERRGDLMGPLEIAHPVSGPTEIEVDSVRSLREEARELRAEAKKRD